jgi:hypothetical protein
MKQLIKQILKFVIDTLRFVWFLLNLVRYKSFSNPIKRRFSGTVTVLANGPSLREILPRLAIDDEFKNIDFIVMNYFAFDEVFFRIKPKHYCLADPVFFKESHKIDEVKKLFQILQNNVDWALNIYITQTCQEFVKFSSLTNKNLSIIKVNCADYKGYELLRNKFYKKGLSMPIPQNVSIVAIYVGLNSGYSLIKLYGVDHNGFFDSLCINENNQLCYWYKHFYDNGKLEPIINPAGLVFKVSEYITCISLMFKSHDILAKYAEYLNIKIINCTKDSLIDSYERQS